MKTNLLILTLLFSTLAHAATPKEVCDVLRDDDDDMAASCDAVAADGQFDATATKVCLIIAKDDTFTSTQQSAISCLQTIKNKVYSQAPLKCINKAQEDTFTSTQDDAISCLQDTTPVLNANRGSRGSRVAFSTQETLFMV